jgi:fructose-1-phosphate kinase PfkB-like protein
MAALAWAISEGLPLPEMARLAVAAGTATAQVEGTGIASLAQVRDVERRVQVRVL